MLTIVMLLGVMPMAVPAEESDSQYVAELTFEGSFDDKTTQAQAIDLIRSAIKPSDSENNVIESIGSGNSSGLYIKEGEYWTALERMAYKLKPSESYMIGLDVHTKNFKFLQEYVNQDLTSILNLSVNGTRVDLSNPGTTHIIRHLWTESNFQILLPISCFGGIIGTPAVDSVTVSPAVASVQKGTSYTFTATANVRNGASDEVTWAFKTGYTPTDPNTTLVDGVLTVGAEETLNEIYLTATSAFDSSKHADIRVFVTSETPNFDFYVFNPSSCIAYVGETVNRLGLEISGTERDHRTIFTLIGGTQPGTLISMVNDGSDGYSPYVNIQIDPNETAETLILEAVSVANPECIATLTITVKRPQAVFTGAHLSLGADLSLSYHVQVNDTDVIDVSKMAVRFTMNEKTTLVKDYTIVDGQYVFQFDHIAPNDILEEIDAALVTLDNNGEILLHEKNGYSVAQYITDLNKDVNTDEKTKDLLRDLVVYCDKAERYVERDTADSRNDIYGVLGGIFNLNETMKTPDEADNAFNLDNALTTGSRLTAAGVVFSNDNKIYVKINAEEAVKLVVKKGGVTVDEASFAAGTRTYYTDGILATEFDDAYTFELYIGESTTAAQTLAYSVNTYAYRMKDHSINSMAELAHALYTYGKSAEAFIAG